MRLRILVAAAIVIFSNNARADDGYEIAAQASIGQIAPTCGVRDQKWGTNLLQADAGLAQMTLHGNPLDGDFIKSLKTIEADTAAGFLIGADLVKFYGKQSCGIFIDASTLQDDDSRVKSYLQNNPQDIIGIDAPGGIPTAATPLLWDGFVIEMAVNCKSRTESWQQNALLQVYKKVAVATGADANGLSSEQIDKLENPTLAGIHFTANMADVLANNGPDNTCSTLTHSADLKTADKFASQTVNNPNPWAGVGKISPFAGTSQ